MALAPAVSGWVWFAVMRRYVAPVVALVGGFLWASRFPTVDAVAAKGFELDVITVVVVGGTALSGGEGAIWRTAVGIGILAVLGNAFDRLQVDTFWQIVIKGAVIVVAVVLDQAQRRLQWAK